MEVAPRGSKLWRYKYRVHGREKRLALGKYPNVSLGEARKQRDLARAKLHEGIDPSFERKRQKLISKISSATTFAPIAEEYIAKMEEDGRAEATVKKCEGCVFHKLRRCKARANVRFDTLGKRLARLPRSSFGTSCAAVELS